MVHGHEGPAGGMDAHCSLALSRSIELQSCLLALQHTHAVDKMLSSSHCAGLLGARPEEKEHKKSVSQQ